ncbi:MAG: hypothetical protein KC621_07745, partial [Myxococcales bacterium]|nr:hypothetical protein [Myxococcales bacterium]
VSDWSSLGRVPGTWLTRLPWCVVLAALPSADRSQAREALALLPPLLLPADVPGWALVGVAAARGLAAAPGRRAALGVLGQVALSLAWVVADRARIVDETREIRAAASLVDADHDGVIAPFTTGARLSFARTGDPYGLRWHPEGRWLREQRATWCLGGGPARVWRWDGDGLAPGTDAGACP